MITLGIETSCDETSVCVLENDRRILANTVFSSIPQHRRFGGVVPEIASRAHLETFLICLDRALCDARKKLSSVDLIAVTEGPGLMGSLLVGTSAAQSLALALKKPLVGVDHVVAHIYAGLLEDPRLRFPVLGLAVSGGHTMILRMDGPSEVRILGRTIDDAAGEAFDKVAKMLGLRYPGGPEIDRLAKRQDPSRIAFNRPYLSKESLDFSFSGLKTAVFYKTEELRARRALRPAVIRQIAAGFQEAVCDVLVEKTLRAADQEAIRTVIVGGGVSANSRLRSRFGERARKAGVRTIFPSMGLCQDNAAMIAALGRALHVQDGKARELSAYSDFSQSPYFKS